MPDSRERRRDAFSLQHKESSLTTPHDDTPRNDDRYRSPVDLDWRHPGDERAQRRLLLPNALEVLLVSDPALKKSAVAIDVNVGSLAEPDECLGLAHFLEHMLFLGTDKYPEAGEYQSFLASHQGHSNAFTANEHTNFHFEIDHHALEGALDRFGRFFTAPLLSEEFVHRERQAVHSEYQKNLTEDHWRLAQVQRHMREGTHPESRFTIGSSETLASAGREDLIAFFETHYSANAMKAVILGNQNLDALEALAHRHLGSIPDRKRPSLQFPEKLFDARATTCLVHVEPLKDVRWLRLSFQVPAPTRFSETHPHAALVHLLGLESRGSLCSHLKHHGLITSLTALTLGSSYAGTIEVTFSLTRDGAKHPEEIIEAFFQYVAFLKNQGYPEWLFRELKAMSEIGYVYRETEEGGQFASRMARFMHDYPALDIDRRTLMLHRHSEKDFQLFLGALRPDAFQAFLMAHGSPGTEREPYFDVPFHRKRFSADTLARWASALPTDEFRYPDPNSFIPTDLRFLGDEPSDAPRALLDDERGVFHFQQDGAIHHPKAALELMLLTPVMSSSPRAHLLGLMYEQLLEESLREWEYPIRSAGLDFGITATARGIKIALSGFSQHLLTLLGELVSRLRDLQLDEATFETIRDGFERDYASRPLDPAYLQGVYELKDLSSILNFHFRSLAEFVSRVTLDEVRHFARETLFSEMGLEGAAFGNLRGTDIRTVLDGIHDTLQARPLPRSRWPREATVGLKEGENLARRVRSQAPNGAFVTYRVVDANCPRTSALTRLVNVHLGDKFFTELRTRQQLGYIVICDRFSSATSQGMVFAVQSEKYTSDEIARRFQDWLAHEAEQVRHLTENHFLEYKESLLGPLLEPDRTHDEWLATILSGAFLHNGNFRYREAIVEKLQNITREELVQAVRDMGAPERARSFDVFVESRDSG